YEDPSYGEKAFSLLSNYFGLSGKKVVVVRANEARLETGKALWYVTALKVASYALFFPIAASLFLALLVLRSHYRFTLLPVPRSLEVPPASSLNPPEEPRVLVGAPKALPAPREENILDLLTKDAPREGDAFLIDFSKIKPSNILKVFADSCSSDVIGSVGISAYKFNSGSACDESSKFVQNFPFKFSITVFAGEIHDGDPTQSMYMFTMNEEGKVESYGEVFDNFDLYLAYFMTKRVHVKSKDGMYIFDQLDFRSGYQSEKQIVLRKKLPSL
ncbi:MAG: hypothetical protein JSR76_06240, partial [Verrucomicrobia bacterium]|nr:hypothetical protein [Verrucomicrobiota bacterium]